MNRVEFPGLGGLVIPINRVAFSVFGFSVYWYGLIISFAFLLGTVLGIRHCNKYQIKKDDFLDLLMVAIPTAIVFARLYYVVFAWEDFRGNLLSIFNLRTGGLAIYGGVIGAVLGALIFTKVKKIKTLQMFDFAVVYLPLGQAIGRWGNFVNQEAFGVNTTLPWGMRSETTIMELTRLQRMGVSISSWDINPLLPVHPTFLYEFLWNSVVFVSLLLLRSKKKFEGEVFYMYMALYGLGRFLIEGLRTDSLMLGGFRVSQILALMFFVVFVGVILKKRMSKNIKTIHNL
jgi:phosphatidylglycerol---prolipoprotein diacylglyceryl transferase